MLRAVSVLIAVFAVHACATADADPLPADPAVLHACVAAANADQAALQQCRGVVANPCIEVEGPSTMSAVLCWSAEADAWRDVAAGATSRLNETQSYRDPARLARANEAWNAWADAECDYWAWEEGGGSGEQVDRVRCAARVTADRAIALVAQAR